MMTDAKSKHLISKFLPTVKAKLIAGTCVVLVIAALCVMLFLHRGEAQVDTSYMVTLLTRSSELTTAKLHYTGMSEFKDTGIAFINKSDFIMVYDATARIGIDLEQVEVTADDTNKIIYVEIPTVKVQEVKIDTSSIKYFDQKFSIFNVDEKEDGNAAIALAEEEALKEIENMGVLQMAQDQSATLVKGILANAIPDGYVVEIRQQSE